MALKEFSNASNSKILSIHLREKAYLEELDLPNSLEELKSILSKLNKENPSSYTSFKGKYQVLLHENLFKWQNPFGEILKLALVVGGCKNKPEKTSENTSFRASVSEHSGTPLALQFDSLLHLGFLERASNSHKNTECNFFTPVSENIGRKLLSLCISTETEIVKRLPIIAVCSGSNFKASSYFGSWKENKNARFHIINKGLVTKQGQLPRLSELKDIHLKGFPPSFSNVEMLVFARYDFIENESKQSASIKPIKSVNLFVECSWCNSSSILEPLTDDCQCFVNLKAVRGDFESGASSLFKEIKLIEALHKSLENGIMVWSTPERSKNVLQEVKNFIQNEKLIHKKIEKPAPVTERKDSDLSTTLEQALIKGRTDLDFTEKLWIILKDCSSTEELTEAFNILYNELADFLARPFVHHESTSTIAEAIKTMMDKRIICPNLDSQLLLNMLLEIGIEKLRRDYIRLFCSLELIPLEYLRYYLQPELHSLDAITCLNKLHSVVELMIVCTKVLNLSKPLLSSFVRNSLKHYTTVPDINLQHVFNFQIPIIKARQLLDPMRPTIWELSLKSSLNGFMKQSIHHYQTRPVHDRIYAPKNTDPHLMLKTASYTYMTSVFIQDELL